MLQQGSWYELSKPVRRIICGHRMNPALFETLQILCKHKGIEILQTTITERGIRSLAVIDQQ